MPARYPLIDSEDRRCIEAANLFIEQEVLWSRYRRLVADIADIDFDLEINSEPATLYTIFVGSTLRLWLRKIAPDVEASHRMFARFHEIIEQYAKSDVEGN